MSEFSSLDDDVQVLSDKVVRVRKERTCVCSFKITPGQLARRIVEKKGGKVKSFYYHPHWTDCESEVGCESEGR